MLMLVFHSECEYSTVTLTERFVLVLKILHQMLSVMCMSVLRETI